MERKKRIIDNAFRKEVYFCKDLELEELWLFTSWGIRRCPFLTSHGNLKMNTTIFVRSKPYVMTEIQDTKKNWHKQYKEIISENREGSEYVSKQRI